MNTTEKTSASAMLAAKYIFWLAFTMLLAFWRLPPWTWAIRLAKMPGAYAAILALDKEERWRSIEGGLDYLKTARETGDIWMPGWIWRRMLALVGRRA